MLYVYAAATKKNEIFLCGEYGVELHQRNERAVQNERRNIGKKIQMNIERRPWKRTDGVVLV